MSSKQFRETNTQVMIDMQKDLDRDSICSKYKLSSAQFKRHLAEIALVAPDILVSWKPTTASLPLSEMPAALLRLFPQFRQTDIRGVTIKFERDPDATAGIFEILKPDKGASKSQEKETVKDNLEN